ncbi:MAG: hypothetical protein KDD15_07880 [Lewinella sp.]|nr:hypothetical protein [Lewinella sp.]
MSVLSGQLFNITDFETGIRYDFITYQDSGHNWTAFERREAVNLWGVDCFISSREYLVSKQRIAGFF